MFSTVRRKRRPLGHFVPESRLEIQVQKAVFRTNSQLLRNLCDNSWKQKPRNQTNISVDNIDISPFLRNQPQAVRSQPIPPEVRWLLTRSARLQRANDAGFSKFRNPVQVRVMSAGGKRDPTMMSLTRQRSMCNRNQIYESSCTQRLQCDILGPPFCTDCTEVQNKNVNLREQRRNFPCLEVHTRSLVAPERVEKLYLSHPQELFHQEKSYKCGCTVNPELEITTPLVYTPHEVFERIRRQKNIERGNEIIEKEKQHRKRNTNTPERPPYYDEKTEPPMDLKVSVTFRSNESSP